MYFTPLILASFVVSASALATPIHRVDLHHRHADLAKARSASPEPLIHTFVTKRGLKKRCKSRGGAQTSSAVGDGVGNVAADPASTSTEEAQTTTSTTTTTEAPAETTKAAPTTVKPDPTTTKAEPTTKKTTTTKKTSTPAPAPTSGSGGSSSGGDLGQFGGEMTGQGTWYDTGLTACGVTNNNGQFIAAVSKDLFDNFPGATANPNNNPVCGKQVKATYQGKSVTVTITDRCVGCQVGDLDFTQIAFSQLADPGVGRISGMTWHFI